MLRRQLRAGDGRFAIVPLTRLRKLYGNPKVRRDGCAFLPRTQPAERWAKMKSSSREEARGASMRDPSLSLVTDNVL